MYQFTRIPFGLKTAGSGFMRSLSMTVGSNSTENTARFVDDCLYGSPDFESHLQLLDENFTKLQNDNFTLRLDKSLFFESEVKFLGFKVSGEVIVPAEDKLQIILDFKEPRNRKQLQSFLGVCTYYRQFVRKYATFVEPFRNLLKEKSHWLWTEKHKKAFRELKFNFTNCIRLEHFHPTRKYRLQTDASLRGISGILFHTGEESCHHVLAIVSRGLQKAEYNYAVSELEMLAVVECVNKLRSFLIGQYFEIITDHNALTFVNSSDFKNKRLIRWGLILQQYKFDITYVPGKMNIPADFFSRNPNGDFEEIQCGEVDMLIPSLSRIVLEQKTKNEKVSIAINSLDIEFDIKKSLRNLDTVQRNDEKINSHITKIESGEKVYQYMIYRNILFHTCENQKNYQVVIPRT